MTILGIWKILGVIVILIPKYKLVKEWAYAGFFFLLTGALISHLFKGDVGIAIFLTFISNYFSNFSWYFRCANKKLNFEIQ